MICQLKRSLYNAQRRADRELGLCASVLPVFRHSNDLGWERVGFYYTHRQYAEQHVVPVNDLRPHLESSACWCRWYTYDDDDAGTKVYVHDALDQRDLAESGARAIQ